MQNNTRHKLILWGVILYLPFSILSIFWLFLVRTAYGESAWQYDLFYGAEGYSSLIWLLLVLLPAMVILLVRSTGYQRISRASGLFGFYCLLAAFVAHKLQIAYPGAIFIIISVIIRRNFCK